MNLFNKGQPKLTITSGLMKERFSPTISPMVNAELLTRAIKIGKECYEMLWVTKTDAVYVSYKNIFKNKNIENNCFEMTLV